ncbi:glycoside hydrolase family 5 protein [Stratiformator vulcanicus]|uniref:Endoglucanase H n=1 Tax=Stratiformator vulcanicus TaxID=2527980 RepID=A0A517R3Y0_9PLAN|nr:glycoside hydrolase family 5 protein [Stratiformator vulcanicus]QDT38598.1 Endoglucanase H precursor [Stratiformator vulcanicus]
MRYRILSLVPLLALPLLGGANDLPDERTSPSVSVEMREATRRIGRSINLGNALEAPVDGEWGLTIRKSHLVSIRDAGFTAVRIPVRWSAHVRRTPRQQIDEKFLSRVDSVIDAALENGLAVILNVHHFEEMYRDPARHEPTLHAIWRQLAAHYKTYDDRLMFELLNEPHDRLDAQTWNAVSSRLIRTVRERDCNRILIIGPARWNDPDLFPSLELPPEDRRLIATFHYYSPFEFTHQGASWVDDSEQWIGTKWSTNSPSAAQIKRDFAQVAQWGSQQGRPILLGEFGTRRQADARSRIAWTRYVRQMAEEHGFAWAYWEFGSDEFGICELPGLRWDEKMRAALLGH